MVCTYITCVDSSCAAWFVHTSPVLQPKQFCTALYSFEKAQEGDLEFQEGDRIEVVEEVGQDWLRGRLAGREGIFPASFVQLHTAEKSACITDTTCK